MPKGGSGFMGAAGRGAAHVQRGESAVWRMSDPNRYTKEITDLFRKTYRSGVVMVRDSRGKMKDFGGSDKAIERFSLRAMELADRMAKDVQVYDPTAAREYAQLRQQWGQRVYVNSREMEEIRNGIRHGDSMLINPRGTRGWHSDASAHAEEVGWRGGGNTNTDILLRANRAMNQARSNIWRSARSYGAEGDYSSEIYRRLMDRYERAERAAWRRRKK